MRRQQNFDAVIYVEPFGMMVRFFGQNRDASHETERFGKVGKAQIASDTLDIRVICPLRQLLHGGIAGGGIQW